MPRPLKTTNGKSLPTTGQSNYLTAARYKYTVQEKRILYRVVEKAWEYVQQQGIKLKKQPVANIIFRDKTFDMPITSFMTKEQKANRGGQTDKDVYDAFLSLREKDISGYNSVNGTWMVASIVNSAYKMKDGMVTFSVAGPVWQSALDFSAGWSPLDLTIAMGMKSAYTMRFYEIARQYHDTKVWKNVTPKEFREIFGCEDKYPRIYDIQKYVIDVAKKELDKVAPVSFTCEVKKVGRRVESFTFKFYDIIGKAPTVDEEKKDLLSQYPLAAYQPEVKNWFKNKMGFKDFQLKGNAKTIEEFQRIFQNNTIQELEETFQYIAKQGFRPQSVIGMFINNIKSKIENAKQ